MLSFIIIFTIIVTIAVIAIFKSDRKQKIDTETTGLPKKSSKFKPEELDKKIKEFYEEHRKEDEKNRSIVKENILLFDNKHPHVLSSFFYVSGIFYRSENAKTEAITATNGDQVKLYHDKNNQYDDYAVKIKYNNYNIGYVSSEDSKEVLENMWKYEYTAIIVHSYRSYNSYHYDYDINVAIKVYFHKERSTSFLIGKNVVICGEFEKYQPSTIQRIVQNSGARLFKVITINVNIVIMGTEKRNDKKKRVLSLIEEGVDIRLIEEEELLSILKK